VAKLAVFGSAGRGDFDPETSDVDFVLEFLDYSPGVSNRFIDLADALEHLLGRKVDVLFESVIRDPDLLREVRTTQEVVYRDPKGAEAAA
jgi:predicted nucleotidyltransferase